MFIAQSCGDVKTVRNNTHTVTTTGTCSHNPKPNQPCCIITHQSTCPQPPPIPHPCPPPVHNYACGTQCIILPQLLIPPPPQAIQPVINIPPKIMGQPQSDCIGFCNFLWKICMGPYNGKSGQKVTSWLYSFIRSPWRLCWLWWFWWLYWSKWLWWLQWVPSQLLDSICRFT